MAATSQRGTSNRSSKRARASSNGSSGAKSGSSAAKRSTSRGRTASGGARKSSSSGSSAARKSSSGSRSSAAASKSSESSRAASSDSSNGSGGEHRTRETLTNLGIGAAAATLGVAGGVLLGRTTLQKSRKVLGVRVPMKPVKIDLGDVTKHVGEAGKQFGKLASEVRAVREKAEEVGRVIS